MENGWKRIWFSGYLLFIVFLVSYYVGVFPNFSYRLSIASLLVAHSVIAIVAFQKWRTVTKAESVVSFLKGNESVSYIVACTVLLLSPYRVPMLLAPSVIFAIFHVLTTLESVFKEKLPFQLAIASRLLVAKQGDLIRMATQMEILAIPSLLLCVLRGRASILQLAVFLLSIRLQYATSRRTQIAFSRLEASVNTLIGHSLCPPLIRRSVSGIAGFIRKLAPSPAK